MELNKENCRLKDKWDYLGHKKYVKSDGMLINHIDQDDWTVTLISKINQIKAELHMIIGSDSVNVLELNPKLEPIINLFKKVYGNTLTSIYDVYFNDTIEDDCIFIYQKPKPDNPDNGEVILAVIDIMNFKNDNK